MYEFDPSERNGPYHYEIGNEECLLVLTGTPTLRRPHGRDVLAVGAMVVFPEGRDGAHQLINESAAVARVLILSTTREPYGCAYPDSGKLSTLGGVFSLADAVDTGTANRPAELTAGAHRSTRRDCRVHEPPGA